MHLQKHLYTYLSHPEIYLDFSWFKPQSWILSMDGACTHVDTWGYMLVIWSAHCCISQTDDITGSFGNSLLLGDARMTGFGLSLYYWPFVWLTMNSAIWYVPQVLNYYRFLHLSPVMELRNSQVVSHPDTHQTRPASYALQRPKNKKYTQVTLVRLKWKWAAVAHCCISACRQFY